MSTPFSSDLPYSSTRQPVFGDDAVATSQPLAVAAAMAQFEQGGNAIDAALAAAMTLTVVEPTNNGLGGDLFALVWDGSELHGLNASGWAPKAWSPERFAGRDRMPYDGWDSATIPGQVAGWAALHERFGSRPWSSLFDRAVGYAHDGFIVPNGVAHKWQLHIDRLRHQPGFADAFLPGGRAPKAGERFSHPALGDTLARIAEHGAREFYEGQTAELMLAHSQQHGGAWEASDLRDYAPQWVQPLAQRVWGDFEVHELPPNGQGIAALQALGMLTARDSELPPLPDDPAALHWQIEATKLALADLYPHAGDPAYMQIPPTDWLEDTYLQARAALIHPQQAQHPVSGLGGLGTVYLCTADRQGRMVSLIQSNYDGFGSGVVPAGTGVALQNRGAGFNLQAGHANQVGPRKLPFHTIIPGFVTRSGQPYMAFGVMGGPIQPQAHVQVLARMLRYGQNPQAALDAPRWRIEPGQGVYGEPGFPAAWAQGLQALGHQMLPVADPTMEFGAGQIIWRLAGGGYGAASDGRRDGHAAAR